MPKSLNFLVITLIFVLSLFSFSFCQETFTITTYYPSPYGSYRELRAQRMAIGANYSGPSYCWSPESCINVMAATTSLVVEGSVGIGTSSPSTPLHIYTSDPDLTLDFNEVPTGNFAAVNFSNVGIIKTRLGYDRTLETLDLVYDADGDGTGDLRMLQAANVKMIVKNNGSVGIGVNPPTQKLDVAGTIKTSGGVLFPDGKTQTVDADRAWMTLSNCNAAPACPVGWTQYGAIYNFSQWNCPNVLARTCYKDF